MDEIYSDIGTDKNYCWTEPDAVATQEPLIAEPHHENACKDCQGNQDAAMQPWTPWEVAGIVLASAMTAVAYFMW